MFIQTHILYTVHVIHISLIDYLYEKKLMFIYKQKEEGLIRNTFIIG